MLRLQVWLVCVRDSLEQITWKYRLEAVTVIGANLAAAASALLYTGSCVPTWQQTDGAGCRCLAWESSVIYLETKRVRTYTILYESVEHITWKYRL